jgi:hypothetical protein
MGPVVAGRSEEDPDGPMEEAAGAGAWETVRTLLHEGQTVKGGVSFGLNGVDDGRGDVAIYRVTYRAAF